jgi:5'-nucleotidase
MNPLTTIIDIDGTLCDTLPTWLDAIGKKTGVYAKLSDIVRWNMHECPPLDTLQPDDIYGFLDEPNFNLNLPVMSGAQDAVRQLMSDGHKLYFVTARFGLYGMPETLQWMERHFPAVNARKQLGFFADKHLIRADVIVDDRADTLETYWRNHPHSTSIGIGYPYNARLIGWPQYCLVPYGPDAWSEIVKIVGEKARS